MVLKNIKKNTYICITWSLCFTAEIKKKKKKAKALFPCSGDYERIC